MHPQQGKIIADADMDLAMSYCYDRGNGQYTRLVPVDMLLVEWNIPRRVSTDEGIIILPFPRQWATDGQPANSHLETRNIIRLVSTPQRLEGNQGSGLADSHCRTRRPPQALELAEGSPLHESKMDPGLCLS